MAQRDYVSRGRSGARRKSNQKRTRTHVSKTMLVLAIAMLAAFSGGLYFLTHHTPDTPSPLTNTPAHPINDLPPKPEERWSYIKELENRQIDVTRPVEPSANSEGRAPSQLTDEQKKLLDQIQSDMRQQPSAPAEAPSNALIVKPETPPTSASEAVQNSTNSQPENRREPQPIKPEKPADKKIEKENAERWLLQCGSVRNSDQAESIRAQLAFAGIESRVTSAGGWHRVVLGPFKSRDGADKMVQRLKTSGVSGCITLNAGG